MLQEKGGAVNLESLITIGTDLFLSWQEGCLWPLACFIWFMEWTKADMLEAPVFVKM
jgi:hypothetical protein